MKSLPNNFSGDDLNCQKIIDLENDDNENKSMNE